MDKFFYRLTVQTVIKGVLTAVISLFSTALLYVLFISILQPISANVDYWIQVVVAFAAAAVTSFMLVEVKDNYTTMDTYSTYVGNFWAERAYRGKKISFLAVELMMLPLLLLAVAFASLFYLGHASVLSEYMTVYPAEEISKSLAQDVFFENILHFAKLVLAVFFFAQWRHVREFSKKGRCPYCKAAFSLGYHRSGEERTTNTTKISKKGKTKVVGASYRVTIEDGNEIDRTKISDVYGTTYDYYQTNTRTTYKENICHCAICGELCTRTDTWSTSTTTKL